MRNILIVLMLIIANHSFAQDMKHNASATDVVNVSPEANQSVAGRHKVRISRIIVDATRIDEYNAFLKEGVENSMRLEPGVLTLYATAENDRPNHITILEIYADEDAYIKHINTPHFLKYKNGTLDSVIDLHLIYTTTLIEGVKIR